MISRAEAAMTKSIKAEYHDGMKRGEAAKIIVDAMSNSFSHAETAEHGVEKLISGINSQDAQ